MPPHEVLQLYRKRNWVAFWFLGLINNFHYCLVLDAADNIATYYNLKSYVALVSWCNVLFGILVRLLNAFVFDRVPYSRRFWLSGAQTLIGIGLVSVARFMGSNDWFRFILSLAGVVFCGNGSTYGESVALGYVERFPSSTVGGWSSGTGMSGVLASLVYLGLSAAGLSNTAIFLLSAPLVLVFWSMFFLVLVLPDGDGNPASNLALHYQRQIRSDVASEQPESPLTTERDGQLGEGDGGASLSQQQQQQQQQRAESLHLLDDATPSASVPQRSSSCLLRAWFALAPQRAAAFVSWKNSHWELIKEVHRCQFSQNIHLFIVYVAEYAVQFMTPFAFPCAMVKSSANFWIANSFVVTQFCYQVGVLISRSSLVCIRIRRVAFFSVLQTANAIVWFVQAKTLLLANSGDESKELTFAFILFAYMVFVGLLGGATYVNVFYNILESEDGMRAETPSSSVQQSSPVHSDRQLRRQLGMNIGAVYAIAGISMGSFVDLVFSNTVLTTTC